MIKKRALITGISGQDGSYLAEFLLEKGYEVHGLIRHPVSKAPNIRLWRITHLLDKIVLHTASMEKLENLLKVIDKIKPDECYHLAAQSFVDYSFEDGSSVIGSNVNTTLHLLSAIKQKAPQCKFYFSASSEMFGLANESPQNESTSFHPRSPYGVSKVACFFITQNYRETQNIFAVNGIMYNHESPRRGLEYVTRKISSGAAKIKLGLTKELRLGNLDAQRDWGYAPEYVEAMWLMLQNDKPDNYVIATGETHSVRDFMEEAFKCAGLNWKDYVKTDENFYRPSENCLLRGNAQKAAKELKWSAKVKFKELVHTMVDSDLKYFSDPVNNPLLRTENPSL